MNEPRLDAPQIAELRRELVEYNRTDHAAFMYELMIRTGRQQIRPPGTNAGVARLLARTEADRLAKAELWHVDPDLADLVDAAYPTMPPFAPRPFDLPSLRGFVTFARPLTCMIRDAIPMDRVMAEQLAEDGYDDPARVELMRSVATDVTVNPVGIIAASWGPMHESALGMYADRQLAGGVWMSFYAMPASVLNPEIVDRLGPDVAARHRADNPTLTVDNELVLGWHPEGTDPAPYRIDIHTGGTAAWGAAVLTAFLLSRQGNVAETDELPVPRAERRRHERAGLDSPGPVRVLRLRRAVKERTTPVPADETETERQGRVYRHRWVVRDHWRNYWYPSLGVHRPRWVAPYIAGPEGLPLLGGDKVIRLSAPPAPPSATEHTGDER